MYDTAVMRVIEQTNAPTTQDDGGACHQTSAAVLLLYAQQT